MAVIKFGSAEGENFDLSAILESFSADVDSAKGTEGEVATATRITLTGDDFTITLTGSGFKLDEEGNYDTGGKTSTLTYIKNGVTVLSVTGLSVSPETLSDELSSDIWDFWYALAGGSDTLTGGAGNDYLFGSNGNDKIYGGDGDDDLEGGNGNDTLVGGAGADWMHGWAGNDIFNGTAAKNDTDDYDIVDYFYEGRETEKGVRVNMSGKAVKVDGKTIAAGKAIDAFGNTDTLIDMEEVRGTQFDDYVNTGSTASEARWVIGLAGNDTLVGGAGIDMARYDRDERLNNDGSYRYLDEAQAAAAEQGYGVIANLTAGKITVDELELKAGEIKDTFGDIDKTTSFENVSGTSFRDHMEGGEEANYFRGNGGNDTLKGGGGDDELDGGEGNDTQEGGNGDDLIWGDIGSDVIDGGEGYDHLNYRFLTEGVSVNLSGAETSGIAAGTAAKTYIDSETGDSVEETDTITGIERVTGTFYDDVIVAAELEGEFYFNMAGLAGEDTLVGSENGKDRIRYDKDADYKGPNEEDEYGELGILANLTGDQLTLGDVTLEAGTVRDGYGDIDTVSHIDAVLATNAVDIIRGGSLDEIFHGYAGDDDIDGGDGHDGVSYYNDANYTAGKRGVIINLSDVQKTVGKVKIDKESGFDGFGNTDHLKSIEEVYGTVYADTMFAADDGSVLNGMEGKDTLNGGAGNDTLDGGAGDDILVGGAGDDIYVVDSLKDKVTETGDTETGGSDTIEASLTYTLAKLASIENLTLTGTKNINATGNKLDNELTGNDGNNMLNGGAGADNMVGGAGNDTYVVDNAGDVVEEKADGGTNDTVQSSVTYTLSENVENLVLTGKSNIDGTGNDEDNVLTGNAGKNVLTGGAGNDTYIIGKGDSVVEGENGGTDTVVSAVTISLDGMDNIENLTLSGKSAINATGDDEDNVLTGNAGKNVLTGGAGNDTYIVGKGDRVVELAEGGDNDTVKSDITWALEANVENLVLTGSAHVNGTGNADANTLTGNGGNNVLNGGAGADEMIGGAGNDTYVVDDEGDRITEADGEGTADTVQSSVTYTLSENVENLILTGTGTINGTGNDLDNVLTGNSAANVLSGGAGDDIYVVGTGDTIVEEADNGNDTVQSAVTFSLDGMANVENLTLTGKANINGTGNDEDNVLIGNAGKNVLTGGAGNDIYIVGKGDSVVEGEDGGDDTVQSDVTFTLSAHVENLVLTGKGNINGTGNELANELQGNTGNNSLTGGAGADTFVVGTGKFGKDTITDFKQGEDVLDIDLSQVKDMNGDGNTSLNEVLAAAKQVGKDTVITLNGGTITLKGINQSGLTAEDFGGVSSAPTLYGSNTRDLLSQFEGGEMRGGLGDDIYFVDNANDIAVEKSDEGRDAVLSEITYTLGDNVEGLLLIGAGNINGTGNALDNILEGNSGANALYGGAGDDWLSGGGGTDTLTGGTGNDSFVLIGNVIITDFQAGDRLVINDDDYMGNAYDKRSQIQVQSDENGNVTLLYDLLLITLEGITEFTPDENNVVFNQNSPDDEDVSREPDTFGSGVPETLTGGAGNDSIMGLGGDDILNGEAGLDYLSGGSGNDMIYGGSGNDEMTGGLGDDTIYGGDGNDEVYEYDEEAFEASGNDTIYGGAGDDALDDQFGNNSINGDDGNDFLYGSKDGMNTLTGGAGNDTFFFTGNSVVTDFQGGGAAGGDLIVLATEFLSDLTGDGVIDEADAVASFEVSGDDLVAALVVDGQTFTMTLTGLATTTLTTDDFITVSFG